MKKQKQDTTYKNAGRKKTPIVKGKKICSKCQQSKCIEKYSTPTKPWCKACVKIYNKKYNKNNWGKISIQLKEYESNNRKSINANRRKRWANDLEFKLTLQLRNRINECVKKYNNFKKDTYRTELGCSISSYIKHIESQFDGKMNWENHGEYWEIDHILPLSKGGSFHYSNTQPLTKEKNRKKSNKLWL